MPSERGRHGGRRSHAWANLPLTLVLTILGSANAAAQSSKPNETIADSPFFLENVDPDAAGKAPSPPGLTGDWGGTRTRLEDKGIRITAGYTAEGAFLASGGQREAFRTANQLLLGATLDLAKIVNDQGGTLKITFTQRHGADVRPAAGLETLNQPQEIWGRGRIGRLTEAWIRQEIGPGLTVKAGRMPFTDFASFSCRFQNLGFCGAQAGHTVPDVVQAWPIGQWAAWARFGSTKKAYLQLGVYQVSPGNLKPKSPIQFGDFGHATGALFLSEAAYFPTSPSGLRGSYKVGAWYDTSDANDATPMSPPSAAAAGVTRTPSRRSGRYGAYIDVFQQIAKANGRTVTAFVDATFADRATSEIDRALEAGVFVEAPFPSRDKDLIGIGILNARINPRLQLLSRASANRRSSESAVELFYGARLAPWILVQPGVQAIIRPNASNDADTATLLTLKTVVTF